MVGQTGPYLVTGQQVLVKADSDIKGIADLKGEEVCSASGSTSLENIETEGAVPPRRTTTPRAPTTSSTARSPAMSTDGAILLGYAAENEGELKVVGEEFSEERIGVGYSKKSPEMCEFINEALQASFDDETWAEAFEFTLGGEGVETPETPKLDECTA